MFNLTDQTNLFKINYYKKSENMYNSENVLQGRIKKKYDFVGKQKFVATPLSFSGGVGAGKLPKSNSGKYEGAVITAERVYATCEIDREAIHASKGDKGAFVEATKETVKKTVESYMRNVSRILFGDGTSILGRGDATFQVAGNGSTATPYIVGISAASWKEANFEEKDFVQVVSGLAAFPANTGGTAEGGTSETNLLEVVAVDVDNKRISLVGTSVVLAALTGVGPLPANAGLCMQKSYLSEPVGLKEIFDRAVAGTGSLYNIPVQRRWKAVLHNASGAGVTTDLMNKVMLDTKRQFGSSPNLIMVSYAQYRNILALLEDQKVYNLPNKNLKGHMGFEGVEYVGAGGAKIGIFIDRFADDDKVYFLNDNYIECHHRPGFGWFDDDGTVFLRLESEDAYGARYGGYYQNFITPTAHGFLHNLAI